MVNNSDLVTRNELTRIQERLDPLVKRIKQEVNELE